MNDVRLDARLVAATNRRSDDTNNFVKDTMHKITSLQAVPKEATKPKRSIIMWLQQLHKPALALLAVAALALVSGAVYAAVQFAPAFIKLLSKQTNPRGTTEYTLSGLTDCAKNYKLADRYELKTDAPAISDDEVQKIVQARCELTWLESFPQKVWPAYGANAQWQDGDTIYYTRLDMLGTVVSASPDTATILLGDRPVEHKPVQGEKIKAYAAGKEIAIGDIKPDDTVFTISRISETYHDLSKFYEPGRLKNPDESVAMPNNNMQTVGLVALFKLSLPLEYYMEKQGYLTEIPACMGNEAESCPQTASADIYPVGSEGATNPLFKSSQDGIMRQITGTVTQLSDSSLTLTSRKGNIYTTTVPDTGFMVYNRDYAQFHTDIDAKLKVGSSVSITYMQLPGDDPKSITPEQVFRVGLQLEGIAPKKSLKPY